MLEITQWLSIQQLYNFSENLKKKRVEIMFVVGVHSLNVFRFFVSLRMTWAEFNALCHSVICLYQSFRELGEDPHA